MKNFKTYWQKFFKGELTSKELNLFSLWFHSDDGKRAINEMVEEAFGKKPVDLEAWQGEKLLADVLTRIGQKKTGVFPNLRIFDYMMFKHVALITIIFGFSYFFYDLDKSSETRSNTEEENFIPKLLTRVNPKGQKSKIVLPDRTVVYLNSDSQLSYLEGFAEGRIVSLRGEAFFEISEDIMNPFIVKSGRLSTTALGTSFNVKFYEEEPLVKVTLATGKVTVEDEVSRKVMFMEPGEATLVKPEDQEPKKIFSDPKKISLWKDGVLHFDKTPLEEVITTLERWYGVTIKVTGQLPNYKCTGTFKKNEYLSNVLRVLSHNVGFKYSIEGKEVFIYLKP